MNTQNQKIISVAPMMDWTDRHCRYFLRLIAPSVTLYTEMVTTGAIIHGDTDRFLRFHEAEHPVVLQLGGSTPADLAIAAKAGENYGYDAINLNCGCPSDRVQNGNFGACLMAEPDLVADCIKAMQDAVNLPVTVKCRIGIDDCDEQAFLHTFVETLYQAGCRDFIIHARKAWLNGLSPKQNREIPPLRYDIAAQIKHDFPDCHIALNGGIKDIASVQRNLEAFDGIMIGREAYQNPCFLHDVEKTFYDTTRLLERSDIVRKMIPYIEYEQSQYGTPVKSITRHMMGLYQGRPGARAWRRFLSHIPLQENPTADILYEALNIMENQTRFRAA